MASSLNSLGTVYLVGAGPGAPGLVTLRAVECLSSVDVVLYDYLVNPQLLEHAPQAEKICLGRHGHTRIWTQEEINREIVKLATSGKSVVRLKSGDPAVFARGAEEAEVLQSSGIPWEIVPGITAALAAGSCAGIPITHRDMSSAVALITGQQRSDKPQTDLDYTSLASFPGTLVFYMGVTTAPRWTAQLIAAGKPPETPTAIVRRCSWADQQSIRCRLDEVVKYTSGPDAIRPPAIVIVGEVVDLASTLDWWERRPLVGTRVLVTRPESQCAGLRRPLAELGADVLFQPAIEITPPDDWKPVDDAIERMSEFDWVVFSSTNGVDYLFEHLLDRGEDMRKFGGVKLAAIGSATTARLADYHLRADLEPSEYRAEALAEGLATDASGKRFLLIRASRGREVLAETLQAAGGEVEQVVVYQSSDVEQPEGAIEQALAAGEIDWVTVTSSAIARSLAALFGESLRKTRLASISPVTSATLEGLGYEVAAEAKTYTMAGVVEAIVESEA